MLLTLIPNDSTHKEGESESKWFYEKFHRLNASSVCLQLVCDLPILPFICSHFLKKKVPKLTLPQN